MACTSPPNGPKVCAETAYPVAGIRDLHFTGIHETGESSAIALSDYFQPCATETRLLALRIVAGWCGTCRWQASHTTALFDPAFANRLEIVDVVIANDDNVPARVSDLDSFRKWVVRDGPRTVVADPGFQLASLLPDRVALPVVVLVDRRTMSVVAVVAETDTSAMSLAIAAALGVPAPAVPSPTDGRFGKWEVDMMQGMLTPGAPPPDPSNAKADDALAAKLGSVLFSDPGFSQNGQIACTTCHMAKKAYSDGAPTSTGVGPVDRNAPSISLASHGRWAFWDGRADSIWSQALGPIEAPNEMGSSRLRVAHWVNDNRQAEYASVFGMLPPLADTTRFPLDGKPKDAAWEAMAQPDKDEVNRVFANVGKAIEAHERTFRVQPNALDHYITGDTAALTDVQKDGLHAFFVVGCAQCHWGPRLTDDAFHALRFPTGRIDGAPDRGRIDAIATLGASAFNRRGAFSDARTGADAAADPSMLGAFKTPTLRGLPSTAPYGHGGTFATLADIVALYAKGGDALDAKSVGTLERWLPKFDDKNAAALVEILNAMTADPQN